MLSQSNKSLDLPKALSFDLLQVLSDWRGTPKSERACTQSCLPRRRAMLLMLKDEFIHILRVSHFFLFSLSLYLFLRNSSYLFLSFSFLLSLSLSLSLIYCDGRGSLPNDEGNKAGPVDDTGYCRASHTGDAVRGRGRERERGMSSELANMTC